MPFLGELAGLLTSIAWSVTSVLFTMATQQVGSIIVNRIRVIISMVFLVLLNWIFFGYLIPLDAGVDRWTWFALSGAVGYVIGDMFLLQSYLFIGPQLGMLMMSLAPLLSAGMAWAFFGETLTGMQLLGVLITLAGVTLVILRRRSDVSPQFGRTIPGVLLGLGAAAGQAVGYILSKQGLEGGFPPLAGNSIRMLAAVILLWVLTFIQGKARETFNSVRTKPKVLGWLTIAALTGPVLGATLSLFALQNTQVGVASTLIALPPVFLLPVSWLVFKEKFDWGAVAGTVVTIAGVALLFLA